jgi:hypothetical protein
MGRHLLRAAGGFFVLVVCLTSLSGPAKAQAGLGLGLGPGGILNDPFTFYYAFYLPNQQLQAMRSTPMDSINNAMVTRQYYAQNERRNLYNPISPYAEQNYDPLRPYSRQQGQERVAKAYRYSQDPSNSHGTGPSLYYGRTTHYFPGLREGRGRNANVYTRGGASRPRGGAGGGGMGGMGAGGMGGMGGGAGGMGGMGGMM